MKRYRYGNPSSRTALQKARPYIRFFVAWNLLGVIVWKYFNSRAEEKDSDWFSKSEVDRIATLTGSAHANTQKSTFSFTKKEESGD